METIRHADDKEVVMPTPPIKKPNSNRLKKFLPGFLLLLPLLLFVLSFFVVPMLYIFYLSFIDVKEGLNVDNAVYSFNNYVKFFSDPYYLNSLWLTIKISFYTVVFCLLLGYPVALTMAKSSARVRSILTLLVVSPLLISVVVRNFGWYLLLLPNGTINTFLMKMGIIEQPIKLLFSEIGVVIGLASAYLPFMILAIATSLYNIDPSLEKASGILGASPLRTFFSITLPLSLPGIVAGTTLVFSVSMSAYVTPVLMGGAGVPVLPVVTYERIMTLFQWTFGSAMSYILLAATLVIVMMFTRSLERSKFGEVFR
ncbi:ABC transporter permease [Bacillus sp. S/N-304-OC-R1]|uniref:ABC transporter permease n=1 Tax=Bacillus sp. S/N-304-OC-R1 TaxID=2758034 RepID=UPI001C8DB7D4|nr:ABC transporter permease [Bacillus sp. S/N-304-OC-R1]MBY0121125.1 ABC transporter permease [Bacillus sp. S/N-304-OC-R1]